MSQNPIDQLESLLSPNEQAILPTLDGYLNQLGENQHTLLLLGVDTTRLAEAFQSYIAEQATLPVRVAAPVDRAELSELTLQKMTPDHLWVITPTPEITQDHAAFYRGLMGMRDSITTGLRVCFLLDHRILREANVLAPDFVSDAQMMQYFGDFAVLFDDVEEHTTKSPNLTAFEEKNAALENALQSDPQRNSALAQLYSDTISAGQKVCAYQAVSNYAQALEELATETGDHLLHAEALYHLAQVLDIWGEWDKALDLYSQALALRDEHGDTRGKVLSLLGTAKTLYRRGEYDQVTQLLDQVEIISDAQQDAWLKAKMAIAKGGIAQAKNELDLAKSIYQQAADVAQKLGDDAILAEAWRCLSSVKHQQDELEDAYRLLKMAVPLFKQEGRLLGLALCYDHQATILQVWGKLEEAYTLHLKEEELQEAMGNQALLANCYGNQAAILNLWNRQEEAYELYQKAEKLDEALDNQTGLANNYHNQALILHESGHLEEAYMLLQKAERIQEDLKLIKSLGHTYNTQGAILSQGGDSKLAFEKFRRAEEIFGELEVPDMLYLAIANQARQLEQQYKAEAAAAKYKHALAVAENREVEGDQLYCLKKLGICYSEIERWEEAVDACGQTVTLGQKLDVDADQQAILVSDLEDAQRALEKSRLPKKSSIIKRLFGKG